MNSWTDSHPLGRMFAGLAEHAFIAEMGLTNTNLVDYIAGLLLRFVHRDNIFAVQGPDGRRLEELAAMMLLCERSSSRGNERRELYRHMGDFALFWTGVYPEALQTRSVRMQSDAVLNYCAAGKRSYQIASTYTDTPEHKAEAPVLRQISEEFDICVAGLRRVRGHLQAA